MSLLRAIGEYSYKMRIEGNWFVNFADAIPVLTYPPALLAKYGLLFKDESMKQYSAFMLNLVNNSTHSYYTSALSDLNEFFNFVNTHREIEKFKPIAPKLDLVWLSDIQVVNTRSKKEATNTFFLAAKAGTNRKC